mgnify:CR=1 FL=1
MKKQDYTLRIGLSMFAVIVAFFFLMKILGLEHITELRFFNIVIVAYFSNRLAKMMVEDANQINYLDGLRSIFLANGLNVALSIIGLVIYTGFIDTNFMSHFSHSLMFGDDITLVQMVIGVFMEGMAGAAIISFATMQYWKNVKRTTRKINLYKV